MRFLLPGLCLCLLLACGPPTSQPIRVVSHRGLPGLAPENSLAGIEKAIELGCDAVEVDVRTAPDGRLVLRHDPLPDPTRRAETGLLDAPHEAETKEGLRAGPAGAWPSLDEALAAARGRIDLLLDLKDADFGHVTAAVRRAGQGVSVYNVVYSPGDARRLRRRDPAASIILSCDAFSRVSGMVTELSRRFPGIILSGGLALWNTGSHYEEAQRARVPICVNVVDSQSPEEELQAAINLRPAMIQTDQPRLLMELLDRKGLASAFTTAARGGR